MLEKKDHLKIQSYRNQKLKIVFTNGCFDILHVGHIRLLNWAKSLGDILVLGINSDQSVQKLKGLNRPINTLNDRLEVLNALKMIDLVIPFNQETPLELIIDSKPDILVKGGDYQKNEIIGAKEVESWGGIVKIFPFVEGKSTTNILKEIKHEL